MKRETWEAFRASGLLWLLNPVLHAFGRSIVFEVAEDGRVLDVYPARTTWLGFDEDGNREGQARFRQFVEAGGIAWEEPDNG